MSEAGTRVRARSAVGSQVDGMLSALKARGFDITDRLGRNAIAELQTWDDLVVVALDTPPTSECSIAGVYLDSFTPPRIGIGRSASKPRAQFTALHELGHHLQVTDNALVDQLAQQDDAGRILEEMACDEFAARILIPSETIRQILGAGTPTAKQVVELWHRASASRAAVCVAAARQLASPGHVILLDGAGSIEFSASHIEFPLRRGSDQSGSEIYKAFTRTTLSTATSRQSRFTYKGGAFQGPELYTQATEMGGYTIIVAVTDGAPWERISLTSRAPLLSTGWRTCLNCGERVNPDDTPCPLCGVARCPECGRCECPSRVEELTCQTCFLVKPAHQFEADGVTCNEC